MNTKKLKEKDMDKLLTRKFSKEEVKMLSEAFKGIEGCIKGFKGSGRDLIKEARKSYT